MVIDSRGNESIIAYPCEWLYKVIGSDKESVHRAVADIIQENTYHIATSKSSRTGKYQSFNVKVTVHNKETRDKIYKELSAHSNIKLVL